MTKKTYAQTELEWQILCRILWLPSSFEGKHYALFDFLICLCANNCKYAMICIDYITFYILLIIQFDFTITNGKFKPDAQQQHENFHFPSSESDQSGLFSDYFFKHFFKEIQEGPLDSIFGWITWVNGQKKITLVNNCISSIWII